MAIHLLINMLNGGTNIEIMPITAIIVVTGIFGISPIMSSISRVPMACSILPMQRNSSDFESAWKQRIITPAAYAIGVPMPAQATIKPRFAIVE